MTAGEVIRLEKIRIKTAVVTPTMRIARVFSDR